jgi:U3 small nucleolar ribonucleoprotein protein IMP3
VGFGLREEMALCRLYASGIITTKKSLVQLDKLSTASFCRRRLAVVLVRLKMSETMKEACTFVEQVNKLPLPPL